jgi:nitrogenase molybdenum-iron protein alpha/beta subunit
VLHTALTTTLSNYVQTTALTSTINNYVPKVAGNSSITNANTIIALETPTLRLKFGSADAVDITAFALASEFSDLYA